MAYKWAVCAAGFIHIILQVSLFLKQVPDACSPAPQLASYIFAVTVLVASGSIPLVSDRYSHLPYFIQFLVETLGTLAILEVSDLYVWCGIERLIHYFVKVVFAVLGMDAKAYFEHEYWLLAVPTTALVAGVVFILSRANLLKCKSLLKRRMKISLNRVLFTEIMAANLKEKNNRNRCLNRRNH